MAKKENGMGESVLMIYSAEEELREVSSKISQRDLSQSLLDLGKILLDFARREYSGSITLHFNSGKLQKIEERKFKHYE